MTFSCLTNTADESLRNVKRRALVMHLSGNGEANSMQLMKQLRYHKLKSKTITSRGIEVTYEVRVDKSEAFLNKLLTLDGVNEASLVAYQSETV